MNLRQLVKYVLWRDTTHHGEYAAIKRLLPLGAPKVVVDVGANDGFYGSNSFPFVAKGWQAVLIEPDPGAFGRLQKRFAQNPRVACVNVACAETRGQGVLFLGADSSLSTLCTDPIILSQHGRTDKTVAVALATLSDILSARNIPRDFGVLSVDTEGLDYEVLLGLDFSVWRPRVIITENFEPKELKKADYLGKSGYRLAATVYANTIWTTP